MSDFKTNSLESKSKIGTVRKEENNSDFPEQFNEWNSTELGN